MQRLAPVLVFVLIVAGCSDSSDRIAELESQIGELEGQVEEAESTTTTSSPTAISTLPPTTTTTEPTLSAAQETYCNDLTSEVAVRTETGGTRARPETVEFFDIAHRLGHLNLPYTGLTWGEARATTPEEFVDISRTFAGAVVETDAGESIRASWFVNLQSESSEPVDFEAAYREVCLEAWELR